MSNALATWRRKLEFLENQEAIESDAAQKFELAEEIAEAKAKIAELESAKAVPAAEPRTFRADISRIVDYAPAELIGRQDELKLLDSAWDKAARGETERPHVFTFVALGGEGKTSLVAKWAAQLAHKGWPNCDAAFAWSFFRQGTREDTQASSDSFLAETLKFFGDEETANSAKSAFDKGKRLAQLVGERRGLLILDGVEPLQYPPGPPMHGKLRDDGVSALLKALANRSNGLCVVTTRYSIPDLKAFWQTTAPEKELASLSLDAGVYLLKRLGVKGTQQEFEALVTDVRGHALTLNLLGSYLADAHAGDIRRRDLVKLAEADVEENGGHAFHVMDTYVASLSEEEESGQRALSILGLLGLFDRPATADCLAALWNGDEIKELTGPLINIGEAQRNLTLKRLEDAHLIRVNREKGSGKLISLDTHPLMREYFAERVRKELPDAWQAAHRRLYEYLRDNTNEGEHPTLEDLKPLYQAITHGCQAGLQQEATYEIYWARIARSWQEDYSKKKLGALGADLAAYANFFESPWSKPSQHLDERDQMILLNNAAYVLRGLGRLGEASDPLRAGLGAAVRLGDWLEASKYANNLSELQLASGDIAQAIDSAEQSVPNADTSSNFQMRQETRSTLAHALHQAGRWADSQTQFQEAEEIHAQGQPETPLLYSIRGYHYCDLLLASSERAAWQEALKIQVTGVKSDLLEECRSVSQRAAQTLKIAEQWVGRGLGIHDIGFDHLTLGRAAMHALTLDATLIADPEFDLDNVEAAVANLRRAGDATYLPGGLLTRAWLRFFEDKQTGAEKAQEDLDEAWEIAERGPMQLYMCEIHLYRARLFHAVKPYPWNKFADGTEGRGPKDDLKDARELIEQCGYWRRKEELEDAEAAAKNWD